MQSELKSFSNLIPQQLISGNGKSWHKTVLNDVAARLGDPDFPCLFSKNAFQKGLLRFIFVESVDDDGIRELADGLMQYVELSRQWTGSLKHRLSTYPGVLSQDRRA